MYSQLQALPHTTEGDLSPTDGIQADASSTTFISKQLTHGREGTLQIGAHTITTPYLFPVASLVTGTTARGGGLWKYVLHAHPYGLMRRQIPLMSQVLHFLDFGVSTHAIAKWRVMDLRHHYNSAYPDLNYTAPLFLDSGGFKLLWTRELDLSRYGLTANPETILHLQRDFGGNLIATLDYPLPPGLVRQEAEERMRRSLENAMETIQSLRTQSAYRPVLYVAAHGQNGDDIRQYVQKLVALLERDSWPNITIGIAIGSLVPLRGAKKVQAIVDMVSNAVAGIPEARRAQMPVHVFGMTGNLVPLLSYLGVDTFDSSTYAQEARSLGYLDPHSRQGRAILEMEGELPCSCRVCQATSLRTIQDGLTETTTYRKQTDGGVQKSRLYADIALHNLELDFEIVRNTQLALHAGELSDFLVEHAASSSHIYALLPGLATHDERLRTALTRVSVLIAPRVPQRVAQQERPPVRTISTRYMPDSFDVLKRSYRPPQGKRIVLFIPCSGGKPYSSSRSHRLIANRLSVLGPSVAAIHKITLSGLYGPVPEECETLPEILGYDFRLDPSDLNQIELIAERLQRYLERFGDCYEAIIGYATSRAYRSVLDQVARQVPTLGVLPEPLRARRLSEFFRREHVSALVDRMAGIMASWVEEDEDRNIV